MVCIAADAANNNDDEPPRQVWSFSHNDGWGRCDDPEQISPPAKYLLVQTWPSTDAALYVEWLERYDGESWFLVLHTPCNQQQVVVPDLPSLLALFHELLPIVEAGNRLDAISDRHEDLLLEARRRERAGLPRKAVRR